MPYIRYPSAFLYSEPNSKLSGRQSVEHYPWGFYVRPTGNTRRGFSEVRCRYKDGDGNQHSTAWIRTSELTDDRPLEINFVDIGQGDGCFIVFPDDRKMIIDAGESDNMYRFLTWRFRNNPVFIDDVVISHPDKDHYYGLKKIFEDENFSFGNVFHNGIVERAGSTGPLGPRTSGKGSVLTNIIETPDEIHRLLSRASNRGGKLYPNLLWNLMESGRCGQVWMVHHEDEHFPGFAPGEHPSGLHIEVLGPVVQRDSRERLRLPWFGSAGKTKNGHSIVMRLRYGNTTALLGGDLNIKSEHYLLEHHTGLSAEPKTDEATDRLIAAGRQVFECDLMKACHHGSADVEDIFVRSVNPKATVISSGDGEPHCHPRPDALGVYGKYARGRRPLIFSTELARSADEFVTLPAWIQQAIEQQTDILQRASSTQAEKRTAAARIEELTERDLRSVAVYGMITARMDGSRMLITQKLERKRSSTGEKWDMHRFEPDADGQLEYRAKH